MIPQEESESDASSDACESQELRAVDTKAPHQDQESGASLAKALRDINVSLQGVVHHVVEQGIAVERVSRRMDDVEREAKSQAEAHAGHVSSSDEADSLSDEGEFFYRSKDGKEEHVPGFGPSHRIPGWRAKKGRTVSGEPAADCAPGPWLRYDKKVKRGNVILRGSRADKKKQNLPMQDDEGNYLVYPAGVAYKIYKSALENTRCRKIGDGSFFDDKHNWQRLLADFPIREADERRLMSYAFDRAAQRVYEEVASENRDCSATTLWELLETRLCNKAHRSALQDMFFGLKWNERRESVSGYAERLRSAAIALPTEVGAGVLLNGFRAGLPQKLQDQAVLVTGDFDDVVSAVSRLSSAQMAPKKQVREIQEGGRPTPRNDDDTTRVGSNRFAHVQCYACQTMGLHCKILP